MTPSRSILAPGTRRVPGQVFGNFLLGGMLLTLHGALAWGRGEWWQSSLMLAHFGFFLLWQPVWREERKLSLSMALLVVVGGTALAFYGNWWVIGVWVSLLFALIGGNVPGISTGRDRFVSLLAAIYLGTFLLLWVVPQVYSHYTSTRVTVEFVRLGLAVMPLVILVVPAGQPASGAPVVIDLIYTVMLFLLAIVLSLGSFAVYEVTHGATNYLVALAMTLLAFGVVLMMLAWLWNPRAGFGGLGMMLSRYLMGIGLPFEQRMHNFSELAQHVRDPHAFFSAAMLELLDVPWVAGLIWESEQSTGRHGRRAPYADVVDFAGFTVKFEGERPFPPSVLLHLKLQVQMAVHFYQAMVREEQHRQAAYTQAIHETGARLTHDVKNLLQSLRSICAAAEMPGADNDEAFRALVKRQLPQITRRLGITLDKLKVPAQIEQGVPVPADEWWRLFCERHSGRALKFEQDGEFDGIELPGDMFDSVIDTLIENALQKSAQKPDLRVRVMLRGNPEGLRLRVCDDGAPMPEAVASVLFEGPVRSHSGLGVGLYQAGRYAQQCGFVLRLADNQPGNVCFELKPVPPAIPRRVQPKACQPLVCREEMRATGAVCATSLSRMAASTCLARRVCVFSAKAASRALSVIRLIRRVSPPETRWIFSTTSLGNSSGPR